MVGECASDAFREVEYKDAEWRVCDRESLLVLHEERESRSCSLFFPSFSFPYCARVSINMACRNANRSSGLRVLLLLFLDHSHALWAAMHPAKHTPHAFYSAPYHLFVLGVSICGRLFSEWKRFLSHRRCMFRERLRHLAWYVLPAVIHIHCRNWDKTMSICNRTKQQSETKSSSIWSNIHTCEQTIEIDLQQRNNQH